MTGLSASSWIFFLGIPKLVGHAYDYIACSSRLYSIVCKATKAGTDTKFRLTEVSP